MRGERIKFPCAYCGKEVEELTSQLQKSKKWYCSRECAYAGRREGSREKRQCVVCGQAFFVGGRALPGEPQRSRKARMCSMECQRRARFRRGAKCTALAVDDAAYLAGIVDGEGSVMLIGRHDAVALRVSVANTCRPLLEWIKKTTGIGQIHEHRRPSAKHKTGWSWRAYGDGAETFLQQIVPKLIIKKVQAERGIAFHERLRTPALKADRTWQFEWMAQMKASNCRGSQLSLGQEYRLPKRQKRPTSPRPT